MSENLPDKAVSPTVPGVDGWCPLDRYGKPVPRSLRRTEFLEIVQRNCRQKSYEDGYRDIQTLHEQTDPAEIRPGDDVHDRIDSLNHHGERCEDLEVEKSWLLLRSPEQAYQRRDTRRCQQQTQQDENSTPNHISQADILPTEPSGYRDDSKGNEPQGQQTRNAVCSLSFHGGISGYSSAFQPIS